MVARLCMVARMWGRREIVHGSKIVHGGETVHGDGGQQGCREGLESRGANLKLEVKKIARSEFQSRTATNLDWDALDADLLSCYQK